MPEKLQPYASPGEKVLALFSLLLFTGERYSLSALARKLECSKQTVLRLVEQIERSHEAQVESWIEEGQKWFRIKAPRRRPNVALLPESIRYLVLCKELVWHMLPKNMRSEIDSALQKATVLLPDENERPRALAHVTDAKVKGAIDYTPHHASLDTLMRAIGDGLVCRVVYKAPQAEDAKEHLFAPVRLISYREALYAWGGILDRSDRTRTRYTTPLAVHRMNEVEVTGCSRPLDLCDGEETCDFGFVQGEPFRVKVKFDAGVAHYVAERLWSADQQLTRYKNGKLLLEFTARSDWEVISWVLGFGGAAELLGPKDIKEKLREEVKTLQARYAGRVKQEV